MTEDRQTVANSIVFFSIRPSYDFQFSNGRKDGHFWCEKLWKRVFACEGNEEEFRLYEHKKGLNYSTFQNNHQIAAFTKNRFVIGKGNRYDVRVERKANIEVVICMVLTVNTSENDNDHTTVTIDVGNIGPEGKPFDSSWEPEDDSDQVAWRCAFCALLRGLISGQFATIQMLEYQGKYR